MAWTIRNYNTFIREAKDTFDISHKQARELYRDIRYELDRPLYGIDVRRHKEFILEIISEKTTHDRDIREPISSIERWNQYLIIDESDMYDSDFDVYIFEGTAEYEED